MSDVFQEVNEDLRRDQYIRLWKAYGKYAIAVIAAIVLGTASGVGYREYTSSRTHAASDRYEDAVALLKAGNEQEALMGFSQLAADTDGIYGVLALARQAAALGSSGDREAAVTLYDRFASGDVSAPEIIRDLAALRAAMLLIDTTSSEEVAARLNPLADDDRPLKYSARELLGVLALRDGDTEAAEDIFTKIAEDGGAPAGLRARAAALGFSVRGAQ